MPNGRPHRPRLNGYVTLYGSFAADKLGQQWPLRRDRRKNRLQILEDYGRHADAEEQASDPVRIRRFIVKAVTPLFTGEPKAKRYRVALDKIAGIPKKLFSEGKNLDDQPPLSELIMNAAMEHLSEETLLRTPQESYDRLQWEEQKRRARDSSGHAPSVSEWQSMRKEAEANADNRINVSPN